MPMRRISCNCRGAGAVQPLLERLAGDERHDQVREALGFLDGVDRDHVIVA
jgi:hypothetical protein